MKCLLRECNLCLEHAVYVLKIGLYLFNRDVVPTLHGRRDKDMYMENPKAFCTLFCTHVKEIPVFHGGFKGTIVGKELVLLGIHEYRSFVQFRSSRLAIICIQASYRGRRARKEMEQSGGVKIPRPTRKATLEVVSRYDSMTDLLV